MLMFIKKLHMNPAIIAVFVVLLITFGFTVGFLYNNYNTKQGSKEKVTLSTTTAVAVDNDEPANGIDSFDIPKAQMIQTDTFSFSWTISKYFGARTLDYLVPQLPEIFNTLGIKTIEQYVVQEGLAKKVPDHRRSYLRCYDVIDKSKGKGIALLCYTEEKENEMFVSVQVINKSIIVFPAYHDGNNDFGFADFDGDGITEVYTSSLDFGVDNIHTTVGVYPFADGVWGKPLFWSVEADGPIPYHYGFELQGESYPHTIVNTNTGYSRILPDNSEINQMSNSSLERMLVLTTAVVDVDLDGIFELIVEQQPFHCPGTCLSLLKYDKNKNTFQTSYAAFLTSDENPFDPSSLKKNYEGFLQQAGYDIKNVTFLENVTILE